LIAQEAILKLYSRHLGTEIQLAEHLQRKRLAYCVRFVKKEISIWYAVLLTGIILSQRWKLLSFSNDLANGLTLGEANSRYLSKPRK
jgi:hypothetical protein